MVKVRDVRQKQGIVFHTPSEIIESEAVSRSLRAALKKWEAPDAKSAKEANEILLAEFPDEYEAEEYWTKAAQHQFRDFFTWGHDHDFGHGIMRSGAMGARHIEIVGECIQYGLLPPDMNDLDVLDVGCWSGGDVLLLAGLGANVTALEEHQRSAASTIRLCELVGCPLELVTDSVFKERLDWKQKFDIIYASGVIYHVTDPLLFTRILFAYLKEGGQLVLETKSHTGNDSSCSYSGTLDLGWNWFAPDKLALGRWFVDAGFESDSVSIHVRENGRLLGMGTKLKQSALPETAGFSRPGSWLESIT